MTDTLYVYINKFIIKVGSNRVIFKILYIRGVCVCVCGNNCILLWHHYYIFHNHHYYKHFKGYTQI